MECWEIRQKTEQGAVDAPPRKKFTTHTITTTKSKTQKQSVSRSAQSQNSILQNPSRGINRESGDADSGTPGNGRGNKAARSKSASRLTKQTSKTNGAKSRGRSKKR